MGNKDINKEYEGNFINLEKMEIIVRDYLSLGEKWQLTHLEQEMAMKEAHKFLQLKEQRQKQASVEADAIGKLKQFKKRFDNGDDPLEALFGDKSDI